MRSATNGAQFFFRSPIFRTISRVSHSQLLTYISFLISFFQVSGHAFFLRILSYRARAHFPEGQVDELWHMALFQTSTTTNGVVLKRPLTLRNFFRRRRWEKEWAKVGLKEKKRLNHHTGFKGIQYVRWLRWLIWVIVRGVLQTTNRQTVYRGEKKGEWDTLEATYNGNVDSRRRKGDNVWIMWSFMWMPFSLFRQGMIQCFRGTMIAWNFVNAIELGGSICRGISQTKGSRTTNYEHGFQRLVGQV